MALKKLLFIFASALIGTLAVNILLFFLVQFSHSKLTSAQQHRQDSLALMYELRQEIDRLNSLVYDFVVTGDTRYLFYYYDILAIREGEKPRPEQWSISYWDRVIADEIQHQMPTTGSVRSLAQLMAVLEFNSSEFRELQKVSEITEEMKQIEQVAFAATQGLYDIEKKEFVSESEPHPEFAKAIVHGMEYKKAKARLATSVENLTFLVDQRTARQLHLAQQYSHGLIVIVLFSLGVTVFLVLFAARSLQRCLLTPILSLHGTAMEIAAGNYIARSDIFTKLKEIKELGEAINSMATSIDTDIARREIIRQDLEDARLKAESADVAKTMFLANMSHEIRTPMNAILGMTHLALDTKLSPQQRDYITKANGAARMLLGILNDILDVSKMESGKLRLENIPFDPEKVIMNALFMVQHRAQEKALELLLDIKVAANSISRLPMGDPLRLGQVLTNLLANAVKFTDSGHACLRMEQTICSPEKTALSFGVEDTGIGMNDAQISKLFQDFAQADESTTRQYGGTGLGLAISQRLIGLMGGRINVTSRQGEGTTFTFQLILPLSREKKLPIETGVKPNQLKVLLVDDYKIAREVLVNLLNSLGFVQIDQAAGGLEALEKIKSAQSKGKPYDLLLLDWLMPLVDGAAVLREIRESGLTFPLFSIVVSAHDDGSIWPEASSLGATHFLAKPVLPSSLLRCLSPQIALETESAATNEADALTGLHVLLAEDNLVNQQIAVEMLRKCGIYVDVVENGREVLEKIQIQSPDYYALVLLDLQMPLMDGIETTLHIRANPKFAELPLVAMTAHAMTEERERCLACGMNDHLAKPFEFKELRDMLARHCRAGYRSAAQALVHCDVDSYSSLTYSTFLDSKTAIAKLGFNGKQYQDLLRVFYNNHQNISSYLHKCSAGGNIDEIMRAAHTLKGLAGSLGIIGLAQPAARLELAARNREPEIRELLLEIDNILLPLLQDLHSFFTIVEEPNDVVNALIPNDIFCKLLQDFAELLDSGDSASIEFWDEKRAVIGAQAPSAQVKNIDRAMNQFDLGEASREVQKILRHKKKENHA